jgi:hypothetical protein
VVARAAAHNIVGEPQRICVVLQTMSTGFPEDGFTLTYAGVVIISKLTPKGPSVGTHHWLIPKRPCIREREVCRSIKVSSFSVGHPLSSSCVASIVLELYAKSPCKLYDSLVIRGR